MRSHPWILALFLFLLLGFGNAAAPACQEAHMSVSSSISYEPKHNLMSRFHSRAFDDYNRLPASFAAANTCRASNCRDSLLQLLYVHFFLFHILTWTTTNS